MSEPTSTTLCVIEHRKPTSAHRGLVCDHHEAAIRDTLRDIVELYAAGPNQDREHFDSSDIRHLKQPHSPAPIDLAWTALTDPRTGAMNDPHSEYTLTALYGGQIPNPVAELQVFTDYIADERNMARPGRSVTQQVQFLHANHDWILADPMVEDYDKHLRTLRSKLAAALHIPQPKPVAACPFRDGDGERCAGPLWPDRYGAMAVDCGKCGAHIDETMLRRLGGMLAS